ncbi:ABC transporter substrate-binding protein [Variovorax rhizosphaerae]|uniref:ABC transporter substrate-binding protein n=1 Tax=Variovorax rhizosphaerae TaxID=1836200 RepID=A0ABU8WWJ7_9BURK
MKLRRPFSPQRDAFQGSGGIAVNKQTTLWTVRWVVAAIVLVLDPPQSAAQQVAKVPHIGFLSAYGPLGPTVGIKEELEKLGWIDGKTVIIHYGVSDTASTEPLNTLAAELVQAKVDVLVAVTSTAAHAAKQATSKIPTVVYAAHAGVETGLFSSMARPGGNLTGNESLSPTLDAKRVEVMKQMMPSLRQVGVILNPSNPGASDHLKSASAAAKATGITLTPIEVRGPQDFEAAYAALDSSRFDGLMFYVDEATTALQFSNFHTRKPIPAVCEFEFQVALGCLVSYGPLMSEFARTTAHQVDEILRGAEPARMPVQQVTRFELVINTRAAKALKVTIPSSVLVRADKLIE